MYLNSGDWVENLTALEYVNNQWNVFNYNEDDFEKETKDSETNIDLVDQSTDEIFGQLLADFNFKI